MRLNCSDQADLAVYKSAQISRRGQVGRQGVTSGFAGFVNYPEVSGAVSRESL